MYFPNLYVISVLCFLPFMRCQKELHTVYPFTYHVDVAGINVTIRMVNSTLLGTENERTTDFGWSVSGNNTFMSYVNHNPRLTHIANYTAIGYIRVPSCSGSDSVMKINETGISTIVFDNQIFRHHVYLTRIERNGVEVWKVLSAQLWGNYQPGHFDFQNLQGGSDRRRADILLRINNLYPQIIENIRSQIDEQFTTKLFDRITRSILDGAPADELMVCPNPHYGNIYNTSNDVYFTQ
ncbi:unnamed protein product [Phaedon cochleariae]|uniref:Uncharacterized protein n=1 Tax=Phaedon cochleariae TaxID=80249 RepID=A0A9N9SH85_PHACE|nr:unnamed protein product [Phaedon cochleariae]